MRNFTLRDGGADEARPSRRSVLKGVAAGGAAVAVGALVPGLAAADAGRFPTGPQTSSPDVSHASPAVAALVIATFRDKSDHDVARTMSHFSQRQLTYTDGTLG